MKKNKFPKKLLVVIEEEGDEPYFISYETPEDISESFAGQSIAVYELVTVGKFTVEKQVDASPPKTKKAMLAADDVCNACGNTHAWHVMHRPRHIFKKR